MFIINPHALRVGITKDWDSKWIREEDLDFDIEGGNTMRQKVNPYAMRLRNAWNPNWDSNHLSFSEQLIHHTLEERKIHLVKLLGKKKYRKTVNKVKTLSR